MNTWKVAPPTEATKKELMRVTRGKTNSDNVYFISYFTGEIEDSIYKSKDAFVSTPPKHTYQFQIIFNKFYSYEELEEDLTDAMQHAQEQIDYEMEGKVGWAKEIQRLSTDALIEGPYQAKNEAQALEWKEFADLVILSTYSNDTLKYNFGYTEERIKELRATVLRESF